MPYNKSQNLSSTKYETHGLDGAWYREHEYSSSNEQVEPLLGVGDVVSNKVENSYKHRVEWSRSWWHMSKQKMWG